MPIMPTIINGIQTPGSVQILHRLNIEDPVTESLEKEVDNCVILEVPSHINHIAVLQSFQCPPHNKSKWTISKLRDGKYFVKGPKEWRREALAIGFILIGWDKIPVSDDSTCLYSRVKHSLVWIKIHNLDYDLTGYPALVLIVKPFGKIEMMDYNTTHRSDLSFARVLVSVVDITIIPTFLWFEVTRKLGWSTILKVSYEILGYHIPSAAETQKLSPYVNTHLPPPRTPTNFQQPGLRHSDSTDGVPRIDLIEPGFHNTVVPEPFPNTQTENNHTCETNETKDTTKETLQRLEAEIAALKAQLKDKFPADTLKPTQVGKISISKNNEKDSSAQLGTKNVETPTPELKSVYKTTVIVALPATNHPASNNVCAKRKVNQPAQISNQCRKSQRLANMAQGPGVTMTISGPAVHDRGEHPLVQ